MFVWRKISIAKGAFRYNQKKAFIAFLVKNGANYKEAERCWNQYREL